MASHASTTIGISGSVYEMLAKSLVAALNAERLKTSAVPLTWVLHPLSKAALQHARWMAQNGQCSHGIGETEFTTRMNTSNITHPRGENVASTVHTQVHEVVVQWMGSQGHHDNIIRPDFTQIGVGVAVGSFFTYWCTIFH